MCALSGVLMSDPVFTADGFSYERSAIAEWLQTSDTSPATGLRLNTLTLTPNYALRAQIAAWRDTHPHSVEVASSTVPPPPPPLRHTRGPEPIPHRSPPATLPARTTSRTVPHPLSGPLTPPRSPARSMPLNAEAPALSLSASLTLSGASLLSSSVPRMGPGAALAPRRGAPAAAQPRMSVSVSSGSAVAPAPSGVGSRRAVRNLNAHTGRARLARASGTPAWSNARRSTQ